MNHNIYNEIEQTGIIQDIPDSLGNLMNLLLTPEDFELASCILLIDAIPRLESNILKVLNTNSKLVRKIISIEEAVNYLGINNLRMILLAFVTRIMLPNKKGKTLSFDSKKYWKHCLGTSIAAQKISACVSGTDESKLFTYGLIHDIGITVLDICLPEKLDLIHAKHENGLHQIVAEKIVLGGITHADIGMWISQKWGLPKEISDVIGFHHNPFTSSIDNIDVLIVHLADSISTRYYENLLGLNSDFVYSKRSKKELNISDEFINKLIRDLPSEIYKAEKYANVFF